jgi:CBS domain-containing protein
MGLPVLDATKDLPLTVHTSPPDISVRHVARLMTARGVGSVVVVDGLTPVGILTDRDVVVRVTAPGLDAIRVPVGTVMSSPLVTVSERESMDEAIQLMKRHGIRRLPVVDTAGHLSTILTMDDILRLNLAGPLSLTDIIRQQTLRIAGGPNGAAAPAAGQEQARAATAPARPFVVPMVKRHPVRSVRERMRAWVRANWAVVLVVALLALAIPQIAIYLDDRWSRMGLDAGDSQPSIIVIPPGSP